MRAFLSGSSSNGGHRNERTERTMSPASETSTPLLGKQAQALIACNQRLQELGIDNTITLPQIVVVGDQSTGKSSLIEALSHVKVPKAKGCCTQCPLAINLSSGESQSAPWSCTISIEEHYDFVEALVSKGVTKNNPFGPWQIRTQTNIVRVKTTNDKEEVTNWIRAAQAAVLRPGTHPTEYLDPSMQRSSSAETTFFSPNVIRLDISEGGWTNLSFIDLPGVIANTGKEKNKYLVKLIQNLVHQYASAERSVNMLTLPMTHDIENSQAYAIIQKLNAESRTLAVLTKADLADDDQRVQFLRKFTGDDDLEFEHGYHFVVMPDNMDQQEAREAEADVFSQPPWSILDRKHQARLGVNALRSYLRDLLFKKTAEALPSNLSSIRDRLHVVDSELAILPAPPNAALLPLQLQQSVTVFENSMRTMLSGGDIHDSVSARIEWADACSNFRKTVVNAKPTLYLMSRDEQTRLNKAEAKLRKARGSASDAVEVSSDDDKEPAVPVKAETTTNTPLDPVHRFRFEEIRLINQRYYQSCVPGEIELRAVEQMNKLSVQYWNKLLDLFMHANSRLLNDQVYTIVEQSFNQFAHLAIYPVIKDFVKDFVDEAVNVEWSHAEELCRLEQEMPLTYDDENLKRRESKCLEERQEKRNDQRARLKRAEKEATGNISKTKKKSDENDLEPDPFQTELLMSVKNKSYYEVASSRFVDNICMGIFGRLLPACTDKLVDELKTKLGLNDHTKHQQIIDWMAENPAREAKRRQLIREKERLADGLKYITEVLGSQSQSPGEVTYTRHSRTSANEDRQPTTPSKRKIARVDDEERDQVVTPTPTRLSKRVKGIELEDH